MAAPAIEEYAYDDPFIAVFNGHINDANKRAMEELKKNNPDWAAEVQPFQESGIMAIFDNPPTPATEAFANLVMKFVNESKSP